MIEAGLSERAALKALTTNAAKILNIENIAGTVTKGKIANLILTDTSYFAEKSAIRHRIIDGKLYEVEQSPKKKTDLSSIVGNWNYKAVVSGQSETGEIKISKRGSTYDIKVSSADQPDNYLDGTDVSMKDQKLSFSIQYPNGGELLKMDFNIDVKKDTFSGTVYNTHMGSFPITGQKKTPK